MSLSDFLRHMSFQPGERTFCKVDAATRYGIVATEKEGPLRIDSEFRSVVVPVHDWTARDEDEEIAIVLVEAGMQSPLQLPSPAAVDGAFWIKHARGCCALLVHPDTAPKCQFPEGPTIFRLESIPKNRLLILGVPDLVGMYVKQGDRRGVIAHDKKGILSVHFYTV